MTFVRKNAIQLTAYGVEVARAGCARALGLPPPATVATSAPVTAAGQAAAAYQSAVSDEQRRAEAERWGAYIRLLVKGGLTEDERDGLVVLAGELRRADVENDARTAQEIAALQTLAAAGQERSQAATARPLRVCGDQKRIKGEEESSWKIMRATEAQQRRKFPARCGSAGRDQDEQPCVLRLMFCCAGPRVQSSPRAG